MHNLVNAENAQVVVDAINRDSFVCMILVSICVYVVTFPLGLGAAKKHERPSAIVAVVIGMLASVLCVGTLAVDNIRKTYDVYGDARALDDVDRAVITALLVAILVLCTATVVVAQRAKKYAVSRTSEDHLVAD